MDNKQKLINHFLGMEKSVKGAIDILKTGDGLGLNEEQRQQFEKAKRENNSDAVMQDVEDKLEQFRKKVSGI